MAFFRSDVAVSRPSALRGQLAGIVYRASYPASVLLGLVPPVLRESDLLVHREPPNELLGDRDSSSTPERLDRRVVFHTPTPASEPRRASDEKLLAPAARLAQKEDGLIVLSYALFEKDGGRPKPFFVIVDKVNWIIRA